MEAFLSTRKIVVRLLTPAVFCDPPRSVSRFLPFGFHDIVQPTSNVKLSFSVSPQSELFNQRRLTEHGPQTFAFTSSFETQNQLQVQDVFRFSISSGRTRLTRVPLASLLATNNSLSDCLMNYIQNPEEHSADYVNYIFSS